MKPDGPYLRLQFAALLAMMVSPVSFADTPAADTAAAVNHDNHPAQATEEYGRRIMRYTARYIGPESEDPAMRYAGNRLSCSSCHLEVGATPGTLSLLPSAAKYPRDSARDGGMRDLRDRINGCMERSMNGRPLPRDSVEIIAMERYMLGLNAQYQAMSESERVADEGSPFIEPDRAANVEAGRMIFETRCHVCHGDDGSGLRAPADPADGYLFPPLWGPDSYNNGAGMTRVLKAARFIKARMPLAQENLTNDQAYDVAAFINSHPRPIKSNLEVDFPNKSRKPVDCPYPPYADDFPQEQHRLGPFKPIREHYKSGE